MFPSSPRLQNLLLYGVLGTAVVATVAWIAVLGYGLFELVLPIFL
jgi:hypothetical protein